MKKLLWLLTLFTTAFATTESTTEELAALHGDSSAFVAGCVNAITGDYVLQQNDAIIKGAEPYSLTRRYTSRQAKNPKLAWSLVPHSLAIV